MQPREADRPIASETRSDSTPMAPTGLSELTVHTSKRRSGLGMKIAIGWIGLVVVSALLADLLPLKSVEKAVFADNYRSPGSAHLLGTDEIGRDILARVIHGARISLLVGLLAVVLGMAIGGMFGLVAGYVRGIPERLIMIVTDSMLAFPALVLLICLAAVFGTNLPTLVIGLAILTVPTFIRLTRANAMAIANREYIVAAKAYGSSTWRILRKDVLPNVAMPVMAYSFILMGVVVVAEGSLSYLGLGVPGPTPSWGSMIAGGRKELARHPHVALIPGIVMFLTVLAFTVIGERYRERFDTKGSAL